MSDWKDITEGVGDIKVSRTMSSVPYPYKKKDAEWFIERALKKWSKKEKEDYSFSIELKSEKKIIGGIGLHKIDLFSGTAETGSWIASKYWRKGYISEAKIALNEFGFNKLELRKLHSLVFADNKASEATQKSVGYKLEGVLKKYSRSKATNKIHDVKVYGLFKEDWKKNLFKLRKHLNKKIKILEEKG